MDSSIPINTQDNQLRVYHDAKDDPNQSQSNSASNEEGSHEDSDKGMKQESSTTDITKKKPANIYLQGDKQQQNRQTRSQDTSDQQDAKQTSLKPPNQKVKEQSEENAKQQQKTKLQLILQLSVIYQILNIMKNERDAQTKYVQEKLQAFQKKQADILKKEAEIRKKQEEIQENNRKLKQQIEKKQKIERQKVEKEKEVVQKKGQMNEISESIGAFLQQNNRILPTLSEQASISQKINARLSALYQYAKFLDKNRNDERVKKQAKVKEYQAKIFQVSGLKNKIKDLQEQKEQNYQKIIELEVKSLQDNDFWKEQTKKFQQKQEQKEKELQKLKKAHIEQISKKIQQIEVHKIEIRQKTQKISKYEGQIDFLKSDLAQSQDSVNDLKNQQKRLADLNSSQSQQMEQLKKSINSKKLELSSITTDLKNKECELSKANQQLANYLSHIMQLQTNKKTIEAILKQKDSTISRITTEKKQLVIQHATSLKQHATSLKQQKQNYQRYNETIKATMIDTINTTLEKYKKKCNDQVSEKQIQYDINKEKWQKTKRQYQTKQRQLTESQTTLKFTEQSLKKAKQTITSYQQTYQQKANELAYQLQSIDKMKEFLRQTIHEEYPLKIQQIITQYQRKSIDEAKKNQQLISQTQQKYWKTINEMENTHTTEKARLEETINNIRFAKQMQLAKIDEEKRSIIEKATMETHSILLFFQQKESKQIQYEKKRENDSLVQFERILMERKMENEKRAQFLLRIKEMNERMDKLVLELEESQTTLAAETNKTYLLNLKLTQREKTIIQLQEAIKAESDKKNKEIEYIKVSYNTRLQNQSQNAAKATTQLIQHYQSLLASKNQNLTKTITYYTNQLNTLKEKAKIKEEMDPLNTFNLKQQIKSYETKIRIMQEDMTQIEEKKDQQIKILTTQIGLKEKELEEYQITSQKSEQKRQQLEESLRSCIQIISRIDQQTSQNFSFGTLIESLNNISHLELSSALKLLLIALSKRQQQKDQDLRATKCLQTSLLQRIQQLQDMQHTSEAELTLIRNDLEATKSARNNLANTQKELLIKQSNLVIEKQKLEVSLTEIKKQLTDSIEKIEKLRLSLTEKSKEVDDLTMVNLVLSQSKQNADKNASQLLSLQDKNKQLQENLAAERKKCEDLNQNIEQLGVLKDKMKEEFQRQLQEVITQRQQYRVECEQNIEASVESDVKINDQKNKIDQLQAQINNLNAILKRTQADRQAAEAEVNMLKATVTSLEKTAMRAASPQPSDLSKIRKMQAQIEQLTKSQTCLKNEIQKLKAESKSKTSNQKGQVDDGDQYYKYMLEQKTVQFDQITVERDNYIAEIRILKEKLKKYEENNGSRIWTPTTPRNGSKPVGFSSPVKEEIKVQLSLFISDCMFTPFPQASKAIIDKLKKMMRVDIESVELAYKLGQGNNSFTSLFAKNELFDRSFLFTFTAKNSRTFSIAIFRQFGKSKHSSFIFCLNTAQFIEKKLGADQKGSVAKLQNSELLFDNGLFRIRSTSKTLYFKQNNAKYFGKLNKPEVFGGDYWKDSIDFQLTQFEIHKINVK